MPRLQLQAEYVGSLASQELLAADHGNIGRVTNTFANSFYVRTWNGELLFISNRSTKSPITINLKSELRLDSVTKPLDLLTVRADEIQTPAGTTINLNRASQYKPQQGVRSQVSNKFSKIGRAIEVASFILRIIGTHRSPLDSLAYERVAAFVQKGVFSLRDTGVDMDFRNQAQSILGLGYGFTPSGDDILAGFLATYNSFAPAIGRPEVMLDFSILASRTSWVSSKLLQYTQRLILDQQFEQLIQAAAEANFDEFLLEFETLLSRGHTSGIDTAIGVVLGLGVAYDIVSKENVTREIVAHLGFE